MKAPLLAKESQSVSMSLSLSLLVSHHEVIKCVSIYNVPMSLCFTLILLR
jgi:hypothetical protein